MLKQLPEKLLYSSLRQGRPTLFPDLRGLENLFAPTSWRSSPSCSKRRRRRGQEEDILGHDAGVDGIDPDVHKPPAVDAQASAAFLAAAEPFVTWLREAESDTEEEE